MLNVLLFTQFFSTAKGGGEYVFKTIAEMLTKNENKVWVVTNKIKNEVYQETDNLKIITVKPELEYKGGLPPSFLDNIKYVFAAYNEGRRIIKNNRIDILHSNNFSPAIAGSILSYFTRTPHITTIHDIFSFYGKNFWKKWAAQSGVSNTNARLVPFFEKLMLKLSIDCIHTVSESTKKDIQMIGTKKTICVIPNCIQEIQALNAVQKNEQFVYLGRLVFYKNLEVVLHALTIVIKQFPNIRFFIAGDGPHKKSLQELVTNLKLQNNVVFVGFVSEDEKQKLLAESNALLFPSTTEGFGLVILEAFQQKKPALVSNIPPMSDIIQHENTGFVIEPHDKKTWAQSIIRLIEDPDLSKNMGNNGNQILKTKYNQELFYENLIKMYNDVLSKF